MAKATKQPSGNWKVRVYDYTDGAGKIHFKAFTAPTKKEAEYMATEYYMRKNAEAPRASDMTLQDAFARYIASKDAILSPTTIRAYDRIARNQFQDIMPYKLSKLSNELIQISINELAKTMSPKSVTNAYSLLCSVLKDYYPSLNVRAKLPQKRKHDIYIPSDAEIQTLLRNSQNTALGIAITLASGLGLRIGEVAGLKWEKVDFENHSVLIDEIFVKDKDNKIVIKAPKTTAGTRRISVPDTILKVLSEWKPLSRSEYVTQGLSTNAIYQRFTKLLKQLDIPSFRFHDLRHYNASVMLAMGVPNKYAQERMGHATDNMLKNVYQHIMDEKMKQVNDTMNAYFDNIMNKVGKT